MSNRDSVDGGDTAGAFAGRGGDETGDAEAGALAVVCGLPGVGKTTVAERIAAHVDGEILRTDVIRKELFGDPDYSDAETEAVYAELIDRARERAADGDAVVLDATFADARFRADVREMGERVAESFDLVEVECDESVVERRIERRDGISDADFDVYLHFKDVFDRIETAHVTVDNSGAEAETFAQVDAAFGAEPGGGE
ncbi:kinase [Halorubrum sp. Ib24]|uniref:AAA family ATPase n=1 Tax=Halorubrum sp. Ib24 TaxID=1383850 RepID=UPI000B997265|nr:AAA family ATPase [Halorubrum sp. Ib24]OYR42132.1 kinase [Halorubrum sp. Ib24]